MSQERLSIRSTENGHAETSVVSHVDQSPNGHKKGPEKTNHKGMGGKLHEPWVLQRWFDGNGYTVDFDIATEGGLVRTDGKIAGYVRPPIFRTEIGPRVTTADTRSVTTEDKPKEKLGLAQTDSGAELELFGFDKKTGELVPMMNDENSFYQALKEHNAQAHESGEVGFSKEFTVNCVEINFPHGTDIESRDRAMLTTLKTVVKTADQTGIVIAPLSTMPHRRITQEDITNEAYIHRIGLDIMTWDVSQHFDVSSLQAHTEIIDQQAARETVNYLQFLNPILLAPTLAGPTMDGQVEPNLATKYNSLPSPEGDVLKQDTMSWLTQQKGTFQSYRSVGRFLGSPSGGILREPIAVEQGEFEAAMEKMLNNGEVPSAGRIGGHHTDRYRCDILPFGTIESCVMDTSGGKVERIVAMREFFRVLGWKMQMLRKNGAFEEAAVQKYPELFGEKPSAESFATAHWNLMKVTKEGTNAVVTGHDGREYSIKELWTNLKNFVQDPLVDEENNIEYYGMPQGVLTEIDKAYQNPQEVMEKYKDSNEYTSTRGFYETGIGNLSQWMLQGIKDRVAKGMDEKEAIMQVTVDVGESYHEHVKSFNPNDLQALYA